MVLDIQKIRKDFLPLSTKTENKYPIYFDNACMTLKPNSVIQAMSEFYSSGLSCHNRAAHQFGKKTSILYADARKATASFIGAKSEKEIIFTRNTTESINLLAQSLGLKKGDIVLTSDFEHNSNLLPWQFLSQRKEIEHKTFNINLEQGMACLTEIENILKDGKVKVVSCFHISHVMGVTLPIQEIIKLTHKYGAVFILDAAQSLAHSKVNVNKLDIDFMAFSFHKIFGPTGMGCLYGKEELLRKLDPFILGGETVTDVEYGTCTLADIPERFEAGLQNYAGAIGAHSAIDFINKLDFDDIKSHELELNHFLSEELLKIPKISILGPNNYAQRSSIINIQVDGFEAGELAVMLSNVKNIMVRSGVHCAHAYFHKHNLRPTVRFSFSIYNTLKEAEEIVKTMHQFIRFF